MDIFEDLTSKFEEIKEELGKNVSFVNDYFNYEKRFNKNELFFYDNIPFVFRATLYYGLVAKLNANRLFPDNLYPCLENKNVDNVRDAFRHAYAMSLIAKNLNDLFVYFLRNEKATPEIKQKIIDLNYGEDWAKIIGNIHEDIGTLAENIMDRHNNEIGRRIGRENLSASDEESKQLIKNYPFQYIKESELTEEKVRDLNKLVYFKECPQKKVIVNGKFGFKETEWDTLTTDKVVQDEPKTIKNSSEWSAGVSGSVKTQRHNIGPPVGTPKDVIHVDGASLANIEFKEGETKYKISQHQYSRYIRCGISTHNWISYFEVEYYVKGKKGTAFKYTAFLLGSESGGQIPAQDPFDGHVNRYRMGVPSFRARTTKGNVKNFDWALDANKSNSFSELLGTGISTDEVIIDGETYSHAMTVQINGSYGLGYSEIILCTIVPWDTAIANLDFNLKIEIA